VDTVERFGGNFRYALDIDFSAYDPSNYFRSLRVHPTLQDQVRNFDELGTGQEQVLALAFAYAYARAFGKHSGLLLVIDEPESHLHPLAQRWLADQIRDLSQEEGLQIIISTHSPLFIDLEHPENILLVRRESEDSPTTVKQHSLEQLDKQLKSMHAKTGGPASIGPFYSASATPEITSGFFARCCLLVEGPTEALALPPLLQLVGFDALREGIAVIPCGGLGAIARWIRLYEAFGIPTYAMFDSDSKLSEGRRPDAAARQDLEATLGASNTHAAELPITVRTKYTICDSDFESAMTSVIGEPWVKAYDSSSKLIGSGSALKPMRARHAASLIVLGDLPEEAQEALTAIACACSDLAQTNSQEGAIQSAPA
jgi:putative ATP-dependent endonuclease of the OLD family